MAWSDVTVIVDAIPLNQQLVRPRGRLVIRTNSLLECFFASTDGSAVARQQYERQKHGA